MSFDSSIHYAHILNWMYKSVVILFNGRKVWKIRDFDVRDERRDALRAENQMVVRPGLCDHP